MHGNGKLQTKFEKYEGIFKDGHIDGEGKYTVRRSFNEKKKGSEK
jgi:hypothetical protein